MFKKILYPTDFSEAAQKALTYVKQLKPAGVKEVVVLNVINQRLIDSIGLIHHATLWDSRLYAGGSEELEAKLKADRAKLLKETVTELEAYGYLVHARIETGNPTNKILKVESEECVSAIVIGSHGLSSGKENLIGSVVEKVLRRSKKPVLVVKR